MQTVLTIIGSAAISMPVLLTLGVIENIGFLSALIAVGTIVGTLDR